VLLLLHGFGANKDNWTRIGKYFTPYFRVIAPDLPGFGESSPDPDGDHSIGIQADRVKAFIRALGIETFHMGGNSMGGHIAGVFAARYAQGLKSLLLLAPAGVASAEPSEVFRLVKEGKKNPLVAENAEEYERLLNFVFVKRPFIPRPIKKFLIREAIRHRQRNAAIFKQLHRSFENLHLERLLKGYKTPTLIVWGGKDRVLHASGAKILESVMPKAKACVLENVGHVPMIERPEQTAQLYIDFLEGKMPAF
jgi:pimeloyl-ACP methyl ester carboxylesterase